ncbi:MAG: hypothetical protein ACOC87_04000, partial [Candidatus Natronoplasma sp.]
IDALTEMLEIANSADLKVKEVPISVVYERKSYLKKPFINTLGFIGRIIKLTETKYILLSFGVPGLIAFLLGIFMGFRTIQFYNEIGSWPIGYVLATVLLFFGGLAIGLTGLILHAIINCYRRE